MYDQEIIRSSIHSQLKVVAWKAALAIKLTFFLALAAFRLPLVLSKI